MKTEGPVNKRQGWEKETQEKKVYFSKFLDTASFDETAISESYNRQVKHNYL